MALLFCDGFDHVDNAYHLLKWDEKTLEATSYASGRGRTGGWGFRLDGVGVADGTLLKYLSADLTTIILGFAFNQTIFDTAEKLITFYDGGTVQVSLVPLSDGSIAVYRGTGTLLGTSDPGLIATATWAYLEVKLTIDNTVGAIEVRVNENTVINLTDQDTQVSGNAHVSKFMLKQNFTNLIKIDDLYVCDTSGSLNNDFLGDITIETIYPTSNGTNSDFTPSAGSNYETVDEAQLTDETDYNESGTVGHKDTFNMGAVPSLGTVLGVQVGAAVKNASTGATTVRPLAISGGTPAETEGDDFSVSQTMKATLHIFEEEPVDAVAWTASKIDAAEFGLKIQA